MTPMTVTTASTRLRRAAIAGLSLLALAAGVTAAGCGAGHPGPIAPEELAEAETFPYYRVYWTGPSFEDHHLSAVDGLRGYLEKVGDSVYYGDCVPSKGIFGSGSCQLPLQVTTVVYHLHSNAALGPQSNRVIRGVPAVVYDEGRSIELYSGRVAIDVFSDTFAHALHAAERLEPVNARGSATAPLPPPVYCPALSGATNLWLQIVMGSLPGHACQRDAAALAYAEQLSG